jgi:hypothetical protein
MAEKGEGAMMEYTPDARSVSIAAAIASSLTNDTRANPYTTGRGGGLRSSDLRRDVEGTPIEDVLEDYERLAWELAWAWESKVDVLCLQLSDESVAPISIVGADEFRYLALGARTRNRDEFFRRREMSLHRAEIAEGRVVPLEPSTVLNHVQRGLQAFLSYRFSGTRSHAESMVRSRQRSGGFNAGSFGQGSDGFARPGGFGSLPSASGGGQGLEVTVSCNTPGLRIHISPAYFISWEYFGNPSSPVTRLVLPGRYVFSGDGPPLASMQLDNGVFSIPPTLDPCLTRF